jgi:hypothetical protein
MATTSCLVETNDLIYGDGNQPDRYVNGSVVWAMPENHGAGLIHGGADNDVSWRFSA